MAVQAVFRSHQIREKWRTVIMLATLVREHDEWLHERRIAAAKMQANWRGAQTRAIPREMLGLPPGWERVHDEESDQTYFFNRWVVRLLCVVDPLLVLIALARLVMCAPHSETDETTWDRPACEVAQQGQSLIQGEWEEHVDEETGDTYYCNVNTAETVRIAKASHACTKSCVTLLPCS